jgi:hypothetical protein
MAETADTLPEVAAFQGAFGRYCTHAAKALHDGKSPSAVQVAMQGTGANIHLTAIRNAYRKRVAAYTEAKIALNLAGWTVKDATTLLIGRAKAIRYAVEGEWDVHLPISAPNPEE